MIDGGITVVTLAGHEMCLYEAMRELAGQFSRGGMSIDCFIDCLEELAMRAETPPSSPMAGKKCRWGGNADQLKY